MRYLFKIWHILIIVMVLSIAPVNTMAQNIFKLDFSKTGGKFADWVQKQYENYQSTMEQISQSQFATTIGDGIKSAKEGKSWAKEQYSSAMKIYNNTKDEVVNSTEYKTSLISKQIADENTNLEKLQKDKEIKLLELKEEFELRKETLNSKLKQLEDNLLNGASILQEKLAASEDDNEKKEIQKEIDAFQIGIDEETAKMKEDIANVDEQLAESMKTIELEFDEQIFTQGEKIAELTAQLKDLLDQNKKEKDKSEENPTEVREKAKSKFSFEEGEAISLKDRNEKEKQKRASQTTAMLGAMGVAAGYIASSDDTREVEEITSATSKTQSGKSDAVQTAIDATMSQIDGLYKYLKLELKYLEVETLRRIASDDTQVKKVEDATAIIDVCSYDEDEISDEKAIKMFKKWGDSAIQKTKENSSEILKEEITKEDKTSKTVKKLMNKIKSSTKDDIGTIGIH